MMIHKLCGILFLVLISCATCFGQSAFQGLTPGASKRNDVSQVLGQPVRTVSSNLFEYNPPVGISKVEVTYGAGTSVVERIEVYFLKPISRKALVQKFTLADKADAKATNVEGKLVEYFGGKSMLALVYASADDASGAERIVYFSRGPFESAVAKATGARQNPGAKAGSTPGASANTGTTGLADATLPPYMRPPGSSSASVDRTGRTSTSGVTEPASGSSEKTLTPTTTRSYPSPGGGSPMTVTTQSSGGRGSQPRTQTGATSDNDDDADELEISLTAAELSRFVGRYEFFQSSRPEWRLAVVALAAGKLKLTINSTTYVLTPIAGDALVIGERRKNERVSFKAVGKPGVKIYFVAAGNRVENLFIVEELKEPVGFSVAVPRP